MSDLQEKMRQIKLIVMDVDGVLTDGSMILDDRGQPIKAFNVRDGFGLVLAKRAGIKLGILTAEKSQVVAKRAEKLEIDWVVQGVEDKAQAFSEALIHFRVNPKEVLYIGDEILDLPVLKRAGLSVTVADGHEEVKQRVDWVLSLPGGKGAVREMVEEVLKAQGHWHALLGEYLL